MVEVSVIGVLLEALLVLTVDLSRRIVASLRLAERCAEILISIRSEIADAGFIVAEELHSPITKLVECVPRFPLLYICAI